MKRDKYLEDVLEKIRQGEPVSISDTFLAVHYQAELREYQRHHSLTARMKQFISRFWNKKEELQ